MTEPKYVQARRHRQRRPGSHSLYLRPVEARKLHNALDALMATDEQDGADPDLQRVLGKLWAIEWDSDLTDGLNYGQ